MIWPYESGGKQTPAPADAEQILWSLHNEDIEKANAKMASAIIKVIRACRSINGMPAVHVL